MTRSDSITALAKSLVAVQSEFRAITKDSVNPHFKNSYASLDTITETVRPILAKHGLAVVSGTVQPHTDELGHLKNLNIETTLVHESGEWMSSIVTLPVGTVPIKVNGEVVGAEPTAQTAGGAITYGRRYGLAALLALTTEEDDDGHTASERAAPARAASPRERSGGSGNGAKPATEKVMPFGKTKGKRLGDLTDDELNSAIKWCRSTDADKFASLIAAMAEVRGSRPSLSDRVKEEGPEALEDNDETDGLPF